MSMLQMADLWNKVLIQMEQQVAKVVFNTWIKTLIPISMTDEEFEIGAPKNFVKDWIEDHYAEKISFIINSLCDKDVKLKITNLELKDDFDYSQQLEQVSKNKMEIKEDIKNTYSSSPFDNKELDASINPKYTFETFVIGNSNRFAHAASLAVSEVPAKVYNPLFLYGGVGLGKTHLMHAIGQKIKKANPESRVLYISSEKFTNELINSIRDGNPEKFRQKYRNIDCLLIDDIQFLAKKEHTQEEFFHTFNTLYDSNKQIVISSDRTPKEIPTLEDRLISRFEWGLITDIQPPDIETRIAILRKKAILENLNVPNDVIFLIAKNIENNIRELEGALLRVVAFSSLNNIEINIDTAMQALKNIIDTTNEKDITIEKIQETVCKHFKIKSEELLAKKRTRNIVYPRQIAMYLSRELTDSSLPRIGEMFGGRDHTTVIHAIEKITREAKENPEIEKTLNTITQKIKS